MPPPPPPTASTSTFTAYATSTATIYRHYQDAVAQSDMRAVLARFRPVVAALELEPNNPADPNAIKVMAVRPTDGQRFHIGYLPRGTAAALAPAATGMLWAAEWPAGARAAWTAPGATVLLLAEHPLDALNPNLHGPFWDGCVVFCPPVP